ncbi:hypothetical protein R69658_07239 [Paraburkholderia aspalathi]|uniref:Phage integrase family protein n=1 Tax=Paraburkholderia aspalathi TaxID=1324617 RepID=A0ABM8T2H1_9BURK|nr:hypothetical protein R69658_07239 [Paraburkholderia aspalathi]
MRPDEYFPEQPSSVASYLNATIRRMVHQWVAAIGLDPTAYGTHTMRRTKALLIDKRTKNLSAVQLLLGHSKLKPPFDTSV